MGTRHLCKGMAPRPRPTFSPPPSVQTQSCRGARRGAEGAKPKGQRAGGVPASGLVLRPWDPRAKSQSLSFLRAPGLARCAPTGLVSLGPMWSLAGEGGI